jgi:hypothetical protein
MILAGVAAARNTRTAICERIWRQKKAQSPPNDRPKFLVGSAGDDGKVCRRTLIGGERGWKRRIRNSI